MSFFAVLGFGLVVTVLLIIVREERPEMAVPLSIAASALLMIGLFKNIAQILNLFESLASRAKINSGYLRLVVKIVGLAYLAGFGAQICKDAGENGMATKIELAGKIFILSLGLPIMIGLLEIIIQNL
ncbi:MAG: stage III sporulation protein AD [Firmicutes bacterium]|nr:stage III sporulation protein AD [Bacillota bacterium]